MKTLLIIQPAQAKDILDVMPIAKHYNTLGYNVDWVIHETCYSLIKELKYVHRKFVIPKNVPVIQSMLFVQSYFTTAMLKEYTKILDLSINFIGTSIHPDHKCYHMANIVAAKYFLAQVPLKNNELDFVYDSDKALKLYNEKVGVKFNYILVDDTLKDVQSDKHIVYYNELGEYNIFDWKMIIQNAKEIHCVDNLLLSFVDKQKYLFCKLFHYPTENNKFLRTILNNKWTKVESKKAILN
jgi:hypothetical protein